MNLAQLLDQLRLDADVARYITAWEAIPASSGRHKPLPDRLSPKLRRYLQETGIAALFSHQREAWDLVREGRDVAVATPTASGKTLCYNLPVLDRILSRPESRALYLFPTKALAQDQLKELERAAAGLGVDLRTHTYDGDTPPSARRVIRKAGHIVITNPDMLHTAILPHHTKWIKLFQNLDFVVIDELHQYRGIFGSHMANLLRRLLRILAFYGSNPQFITCSATIGNPQELAQRLLERPVTLVNESGAPTGEKHLIFYNPPLLNPSLGLRQNPVLASTAWARRFLEAGAQTIVFGKSRTAVELILSYLRRHRPAEQVAAYRGGYLPRERRSIEKGLREGTLRAVAATNALELGIDIGSLEAAVLSGYPGSISSTWQQMGRAGRKKDLSAAVLVAGSGPLDQYIVRHPEYFRSQPPEIGLIDPENLYCLVSHARCAAFELPFSQGESLGEARVEEILSFLESERILRKSAGRYYWMTEEFPANDISLRSASVENVVIVDQSRGAQVIGEVDRLSAPMMVHEGAIYLHGGDQYQVERLDLENNKAYVSPVRVDYYTDASLAVRVRVLEEFKADWETCLPRHLGEVAVTYRPTIFKKIKFGTHENVGWGRINLPETTLHTEAYWFTLPPPETQEDTEALQCLCLGLSNLLHRVAPLYVLADGRDMAAVPEVKSPFTGRPTVFMYDTIPGGMGLSEKLYRLHDQLMGLALEVVEACQCESGCPSCVGPLEEVGHRGKSLVHQALSEVIDCGPGEKVSGLEG